MIIKYINSVGTEVNLNEEPYKLLVSDLFDYDWSVSKYGNKIVGFGYEVKEKELNIDVHRTRIRGARENMNTLTDIFEVDIINGVAGKLYINEYYMSCYIKSSSKSKWETDSIIPCEYGLITDYPFWIKETEYHFKTASITSTGNKKYPYKYPYRYANGMKDAFVINEHIAPAHFKLRIYGSCANPFVVISGHTYRVQTILEQGEYLEIDSMSETVIKTMLNGTKVNIFHYRSVDCFKKILPGKQTINWPGQFDFDLILYEERSEPKWQTNSK